MKSLRPHTVQWENQEMLFSKLTNSEFYNAKLRPCTTKSSVVKVNTSMFVYSMSSTDEMRTGYSMQLFFRQAWFDERLKFIPDATVQKIVGDNWHAKYIWTPIIHAVNDKDMGSFAVGGIEGTVLLHINPDGQVLLSKRVKLQPFCKMQFYRYPMDNQQCTLEIESSILPIADLELAWTEGNPLELNRNLLLTGFDLTNYTLERSIESYRQTGNFSRITVRFDLQREFGHFVLDTYIPSTLFVVTSWLSFWVEIPAAPARVTLSMTTMLTLVTWLKAIRDKLPKVSYVHAMDIWNVVCTGFIFASLVEYALVNYIFHKDKRRRKKTTDTASTIRMFAKKGEAETGMLNKKVVALPSLSDMQSLNQTDMSCSGAKMTPQDIANSIDRKCRYIFPVCFMVFNVIYWLALWL